MFLAISRFTVANHMDEDVRHAYRESHQGIPKGLKLDPKRTRMMRLEVVAQ